MPETLILLHGFSGTRRTWDGFSAALSSERYRPLALDLPGHGAGPRPAAPPAFAQAVDSVLARAPERFALCGYSLGGRVALALALAAPERLARLVLVACSPGIEDEQERRARRASDAELARRLREEDYERFIESWRTQPLFAEDPPAVGEAARAEQRRNRPEDLALVLEGLGAGTMTPLWGRLPELRMPVLIVAGSRDEKFLQLAGRMAALIPHARTQVLPGGHALALECPRELAAAVESFDPA